MDQQTRRAFLGRALLAGAGATILRPISNQDFASARGLGGEVEEVDPTFAAGRVMEITGPDALVLNPDGLLQRLHVGSSFRLWKQGVWDQQRLAPGDCIYARGELLSEGILDALQAWVSIQSFRGEILESSTDGFRVAIDKGNTLDLHTIESTEVQLTDGDFALGTPESLRAGDVVQIVGFEDPLSGVITPTRVLLLSSPAVTPSFVGDDLIDPPAPDDDESLPQCPYTYKGLTTWFCCGGVTGCGAGNRCPGNTSGGSCGGCRSDRQHMAWPKLKNGCGPFCDTSCAQCIGNMPRLACGKSVTIKNPCNGNSTVAHVKDCGPTVHCQSQTGCNDYTKVKFDLTPCAFSQLGNLDTGVISCHATVNLPC